MPFGGSGAAHTLLDVARGYGAIRAHVVWPGFRHQAEHRPADFHRLLEKLGSHAPRSVVSRAALHGGDLRSRNQFQQLASFEPDVLNAEMTRRMIGDAAEAVSEIGLQEPLLVPQHQV